MNVEQRTKILEAVELRHGVYTTALLSELDEPSPANVRRRVNELRKNARLSRSQSNAAEEHIVLHTGAKSIFDEFRALVIQTLGPRSKSNPKKRIGSLQWNRLRTHFIGHTAVHALPQELIDHGVADTAMNLGRFESGRYRAYIWIYAHIDYPVRPICRGELEALLDSQVTYYSDLPKRITDLQSDKLRDEGHSMTEEAMAHELQQALKTVLISCARMGIADREPGLSCSD